MKRRPHPFATEVALCAAFIAWAQPQGWTAYAETEGWDILLVGSDGVQIGIQAKLVFNMDVLHQCVQEDYQACRETGPDFRAILIPRSSGRTTLLHALGITEFSYRGSDEIIETRVGWNGAFSPEISGHYAEHRDWTWWAPSKRHTLPRFVPDVPAGSASPVRLTGWKIGALSLVATAELRGHVTRADFKRYRVDPRRWIAERWVEALPDNPGQFKLIVGGWAKQHPDVYPQVLAEVRETLAGMT